MKLPEGITEEQVQRGAKVAMATMETIEKVIRISFGEDYIFTLVMADRSNLQSIAMMSNLDKNTDLVSLLEYALKRSKDADMIDVERLSHPVQ